MIAKSPDLIGFWRIKEMNKHTNKFINGLGAAAISAVVLAVGMAPEIARAASATGTATATVFTPITISAVDNLAFGTFAPGSGGGTIVITAGTGAIASTGDVVLDSGSTTSDATFNIGGNASDTYAITLPSTATITDSVSGETMTVSTFTSDPATSGSLDASGVGLLAVGATLTVAAGQTPGNYTGTFTVEVNY